MQRLYYAFLVILLWVSCKSSKMVGPLITDEALPLDEKPIVDSLVQKQAPVIDSFATATISIVGDLMSHQSQINNAKVNHTAYNYNPSFAAIKEYLSSADFTIGNLETTFAGPDQEYTGYPGFNTPDAFAEALKNAGFDMLVTANNHSTDTGDKGLLRTLSVLEKFSIAHTGTYRTQQDRDSIRIYNLNGIKLAILNYTYGVNGSLPSQPYMLNLIDTALIRQDIIKARSTGSDIVMVYYHYGLENEAEPTKNQIRQVEFAKSAGADIIIGAHSHVLSRMEFFKADTLAKVDSGFVAWGLGNFISNQYWRYTDAGVVLDLTIKKNLTTDSVFIVGATYLPTWVYRARSPLMKHHVVLPAQWSELDSLPNYITNDQLVLMKQALEDTKQLIGEQDKRIAIRAPKLQE